jgi:hypothetical protein
MFLPWVQPGQMKGEMTTVQGLQPVSRSEGLKYFVQSNWPSLLHNYRGPSIIPNFFRAAQAFLPVLFFDIFSTRLRGGTGFSRCFLCGPTKLVPRDVLVGVVLEHRYSQQRNDCAGEDKYLKSTFSGEWVVRLTIEPSPY